MLTTRYMVGVKNLPAILQRIVQGTAPPKFTVAHLKGLGFKSSNDQAIIPLLKDLKFLSSEGVPTQRYHDYRDPSRSRHVMGEALREAYEDLFHISENLSDSDRKAIEGRFKSTHNASDTVASNLSRTFLTLLKLADTSTASKPTKEEPEVLKKEAREDGNGEDGHSWSFGNLRYNIEIHLPASKDIEVYNAIFKALKDHLA